ncbi:hypothetical protein FQN53_008025 [Emmonsiellopsis sp. PD_33]|nr:hypothetical protein FQN53_008025 [Emmonsiellopsis sp. PD_33]
MASLWYRRTIRAIRDPIHPRRGLLQANVRLSASPSAENVASRQAANRAALANAYVSGLKEDLNIVGNQYNILVTCLSVGSPIALDIIGQVPHAIVIQVVAPRIWFPLMTVLWAGLTMCSAATHNFSQLAAIRFFQGVIEASTYSGTQYIIGSWYKPQEIGKRVGLFSASGMAGTMFAGIMMTAIYQTMNGHLGLPGWRWVFIIDGIITLPIAIFGFAFFPDLPENTKAFYLNEEERRLALARLPPKNPEGHKIGFSLVKRSLLSLNFWIFTMFWVIGGALEAFSTQSCMLLWMKTTDRFTVPQNNNYPLGITAIGTSPQTSKSLHDTNLSQQTGIVATLVTAVAIDATGKNGPFGILACVLQVIACVVLLCWNLVGDGAKMGAYYLAGTAYLIQPVCFTWATKILSRDGDDAARAVTLYAMNGASSVLFSFWGIILYPATDAATGFKKGTIAMVVISALLVGWVFIVLWQDKRTERIYGAAVAVQDKEREMGMQLEDRGEKE